MSIKKYKDIEFIDGKAEIAYKNGMKIRITHGSIREPKYNSFPIIQYINSSGHVFNPLGDKFPAGFSEEFIDMILMEFDEACNVDLDPELETPPTTEEVRLFDIIRKVNITVQLSKNNALEYVLEKESAIKVTKSIMMSLYGSDFFEPYFSFDEYKEKINMFLSLP